MSGDRSFGIRVEGGYFGGDGLVEGTGHSNCNTVYYMPDKTVKT